MYHSAENGKDDGTARIVWKEARNRAAEPPFGESVFKGWHFPRDPKRKWFSMCIFKHPAWFEKAVFEDHVEFKFARFEGNAVFEDAIFKKSAVFNSATFDRATIFSGTVFRGDAGFVYSVFASVTGFECIAVHGDALFTSSTFRSTVTFSGTAFFAQKADFSGVYARDENSFFVGLPSRKRSRGEPGTFGLREEGEGLYRLAKESSRRQGDYSKAGDYYYAEQCAREYRKRKTSRCKPWHFVSEWLVGRIVFGYGEKPHRPLAAAIVVIVVWAFLYFALAGIGPARLEPGELVQHRSTRVECLYFSLVTFTTLGFGDMVPKENSLFRLVAGGEALLGAGLMAMFIVALTRKYMR